MRTVSSCLAAVLLAIASSAAVAQAYPVKPVRMVVPFPAGGATDIVGRLIAQKLSESWGQQVIVDNRGGAGGTIGSDIAAKSAPDGYTMLVGTSSTHAIAPSLYSKLPYDPVRDFAPVTLVASATILLAVHPSVPAKNVRDLIALAKRKPNALSFASSGNGGISHLIGEHFKSVGGIQMLHVPYKGDTPALVDLVSGQVHLMFGTAVSFLPYVKAGRLNALEVQKLIASDAPGDNAALAAHFAALADRTRRSDRRGIGAARFRGVAVVRDFRSGRRLERDRCPAQWGDREDRAAARYPRAHDEPRRRCGRQHARTVCGVSEDGHRKVGQGGEGIGSEDRVDAINHQPQINAD